MYPYTIYDIEDIDIDKHENSKNDLDKILENLMDGIKEIQNTQKVSIKGDLVNKNIPLGK